MRELRYLYGESPVRCHTSQEGTVLHREGGTPHNDRRHLIEKVRYLTRRYDTSRHLIEKARYLAMIGGISRHLIEKDGDNNEVKKRETE